MNAEAPDTHRFQITVIGQEGDQQPLEVEPHEHCDVVLKAGLKELYNPAPSADEYDLVVAGQIVEPLSKTVTEAAIAPNSQVSILPKSISRGAARWHLA